MTYKAILIITLQTAMFEILAAKNANLNALLVLHYSDEYAEIGANYFRQNGRLTSRW